jgi:hypothetical protein
MLVMVDEATSQNQRLNANHLADLQRSGLSPAQIAACGFYSINDPLIISQLLHWPGEARCLGPCLAIPFRDRAGHMNSYVRLKPDRPLKGKKDGKTRKYESPKGMGNHAYFPPATIAALEDPGKPVLMTEGEKKAAKADQEGLDCIGLVGVYGFQKKQPVGPDGRKIGDRELIDDLQGIAWDGRLVVIVYDSDALEKPGVLWAESHLAEVLTRLGAVVKVVRLPGGPDGVKWGLDDYLVANSAAALRSLIAAAGRPKKPTCTPRAAEGTPTALAIIATHFRTSLNPLFRRGTAVYSDALGREVKQGEACYGATGELIELLAGAADAPRYSDGSVKRIALPQFFNTWAPVAWKDLVNELPEEEGADQISDSAEEQFKRKLAGILLHIEALKYGRKDGSDEEPDIQRRSLIQWCQLFAKPGRWQAIRSFQLWCRKTDDGTLAVALRKDLFLQVSAGSQLAHLGEKTFSTLCGKYGVGESIRAGGDRAVALTTKFIDDLLAQPEEVEVDESS